MNDDAGLFLVPADDASCTSPEGGVRQLTSAEQATARLPHVTLPQILYTASVLVTQRNCPVDVVSSILEFAGMFLSFHNETQERVYGRDNMNREYLRLDLPARDELVLPAGITVSKCIFLAVECTSKDQGWASLDHQLNGTYEGSCTWLEVAVHKPVAAAVVSPADVHVSTVSQAESEVDTNNADHDHGSARVVTRHDDADDGEHGDGDGTVEAARVVALYNVRAHRAFRHHLKCYEESQGLLRHVELGDSVRLFLRSQYPGWANSAKFAKVSAFFTLEFDEEFSFADVTFPAAADADATDELSDGGFACCLQ
ncbi:hypothetical protein Gpo141_00009765 [Globisporangium polare]